MRRLLPLLALFLVTTPLFAQYRDHGRHPYYDGRAPYDQFELTPFGGYRWGGTIYSGQLFNEDVDVDSSANYGVDLGIPIGRSPYKLELMVNRQDTTLSTQDGGGLFGGNQAIADFHVTYYQAGIQIPFGYSRDVQPFAIISAGVANLDPDVQGAARATRFAASAGFGVKVPLNRNLGFRLEGRGYFTSTDKNNNDNCHSCYNYSNENLYQGEVNAGLVLSF